MAMLANGCTTCQADVDQLPQKADLGFHRPRDPQPHSCAQPQKWPPVSAESRKGHQTQGEAQTEAHAQTQLVSLAWAAAVAPSHAQNPATGHAAVSQCEAVAHFESQCEAVAESGR